MRKPVFGVCDQGRLELACAATEDSYRLEISDIETRGIILDQLVKPTFCSRYAQTPFVMEQSEGPMDKVASGIILSRPRIAKTLIRLRGCAG